MFRETRTVWLGGLFAAVLLFSVPQPAEGADVCCRVVSINSADGKVTARDVRTNRSFTFIVNDRRLISSLRIGQSVYADFATGNVGLTPADVCCRIIGAPKDPASAPVIKSNSRSAPMNDSKSRGVPPSDVSAVDRAAPVNDVKSPDIGKPNSADACCRVVSINNANGSVRASDARTNRSFTFAVDDRRLISTVRVGQKVYADFATGKVGFTPADVCCRIIESSVRESAPVKGSKSPTTLGTDVKSPSAPENSSSAASACSRKTYPSCSQDHVGRQHRAESLLKRGDSRMASSAAGHAVIYAVQKYGIGNLVTDADRKRAQDDVYKFLSWKLGNPSATAATWLSAGYQHFDRAYSDEAAASLLGFNLPGDGSEDLYVPDWFVELRLKVLNEAAIPIMAKALEAEYGIPAVVTSALLKWYHKEEAKVLKRVGVNIPKKYDYDNCLLQLMIDARRNPAQTRARLQATIDRAAGQTADIPSPKKPDSSIGKKSGVAPATQPIVH